MADKIANVALSNNHPLNILIGNWTPWRDLYTDISCLGGGIFAKNTSRETKNFPSRRASEI